MTRREKRHFRAEVRDFLRIYRDEQRERDRRSLMQRLALVG